MDQIIKFFNDNGILYKEVSENMILFGFNENFICGNISNRINDTPLCRFHYSDGNKKYFKDFFFNEDTFLLEYKKASNSYITFKNKEILKAINTL